MKLRTVEDLCDALDRELGWRKKELLHLKANVVQAPAAGSQTAVRAAITLSYAHLEGFFKAAATYFLQFLASQTVPLGELQLTHQARSIAGELRRRYSGAPPVDIAVLLSEGLHFLETNSAASARLPYKDFIKTHSNLNSEVLRTLLFQAGLRVDLFVLKEKPLDEGLLRSRNHVAHGQHLEVAAPEVCSWVEMVLEMCESLRTELENVAALDAWRKPLQRGVDGAV